MALSLRALTRYHSLELMPFVLPGDCPVGGCRSRAGDLQHWMMSDYLIQQGFLIRFNIHEEDVFALLYRLLVIAEVGIGHLEPEKNRLPRCRSPGPRWQGR